MFEEYVESAWKILHEFKRITPALIMRKLHVNGETANKICQKVWLRQNREARKIIKELELRRELNKVLEHSYRYARKKAHIETSLDIKIFPEECPWTLKEILEG